MKTFLYLTLMILSMGACGVKTTIDPISKQKVNIYENEDIILHYPTHWKKFKHKFVESDVLVSFSRKQDIIYLSDKIPQEPPYTFNYVAIYKDVMSLENFENYIENKRQKINQYKIGKKSESELKKLSENHYLLSYNNNPIGEGKHKQQIFHIHYIYKKDAVYEIELITEPENFQELFGDFTLIFNSFIVKRRLFKNSCLKDFCFKTEDVKITIFVYYKLDDSIISKLLGRFKNIF